MTYLHPDLGSPDPTLGQTTSDLGGGRVGLDVHPHRLLRASPSDAATATWGARLDIHRHAGDLRLELIDRRAELLLDFGTEVEGWPELEISADEVVSVVACFGESREEAEGLVFGLTPIPTISLSVPPGRHCVPLDLLRWRNKGSRSEPISVPLSGDSRPDWLGSRVPRVARFVHLRLVSGAAFLTLHRFVIHAEFTGGAPEGSFRCSDPAWQRLWWTSLYTARLCTRPDAFWDGPKRDRSGWFGDARIIQLAWLGGWCDGRPAAGMFPRLPVNSWVGGVPNYNFDALAMILEHLNTHGDSPEVRSAFAQAITMLDWVEATQLDSDGFLVHREGLSYFGGLGFVDWSLMPAGGRFEELSWLQGKLVEGWRLAAALAAQLGDASRAAAWTGRAEALARLVRTRFWRPGTGMIHTLNHVGTVGNPHLPGQDEHYQRTYLDGIALGPSGPTRQANAIAVLAGILGPDDLSTALAVLDNPGIPPVITPYFAWYEAEARARCGERANALRGFAAYLGNLLETEDAGTIWEIYNPSIKDLRRFSGHFEQGWEWQLSLCHGWGAGFIPLVARHLAGITVLEPGYRRIRLDPAPGLALDFTLVVPTPLGPLTVEGDRSGRRNCRAPMGMKVC
jgi:hypothetical protein